MTMPPFKVGLQLELSLVEAKAVVELLATIRNVPFAQANMGLPIEGPVTLDKLREAVPPKRPRGRPRKYPLPPATTAGKMPHTAHGTQTIVQGAIAQAAQVAAIQAEAEAAAADPVDGELEEPETTEGPETTEEAAPDTAPAVDQKVPVGPPNQEALRKILQVSIGKAVDRAGPQAVMKFMEKFGGRKISAVPPENWGALTSALDKEFNDG